MTVPQAPGLYLQQNTQTLSEINADATAIPAFIGFSQQGIYNEQGQWLYQRQQIDSLFHYQQHFGGPQLQALQLPVEQLQNLRDSSQQADYIKPKTIKPKYIKPKYIKPETPFLYQALSLYYANGGGPCYVISIGDFGEFTKNSSSAEILTKIDMALAELALVDTVSLILCPESILFPEAHYRIQERLLTHCQQQQDRFALMDVLMSLEENENKDKDKDKDEDKVELDSRLLRKNVTNALNYGAAYYPYLISRQAVQYQPEEIQLNYTVRQRRLHPELANAWVNLGGQLLNRYGYTKTDTDTDTDAASENSNAKKNKPCEKQKGLLFVSYLKLPSPNILVDSIGYAVDSKGQRLRLSSGQLAPPYGIFSNNPNPNPDPKAQQAEVYLDAEGYHTEGKGCVFSNIRKRENGRPIIDNIATQMETVNQTLAYCADAKARLGDGPIAENIAEQLEQTLYLLPPSAAIAGAIVKTDADQGPWTAPANKILQGIEGLVLNLDVYQQQQLNVDQSSGKSINALRYFAGQGVKIWGARTLAGNDNEWRYINVRRFFIHVEKSIKRHIQFAVYEPNNAFTWLKIQTLVERYLEGLWTQGALYGATPEQAFFVEIGLGSSMTAEDIQKGQLRINIGVAAQRPAEFIILTLIQHSQAG